MPIVGKPFVLGGGGSKNIEFESTDAILRVLVQAGTKSVITKGNIIKRANVIFNYDLDTSKDYHYFIINSSLFDSNNSWTIRLDNNGEIRTENIIIDNPYEYTVQVDYSLPAGYTKVDYVGYTAVNAVNTYYFTVPNPFAGFTFADRFKITSEHYWQAQETDYQGPYGNYSATNTFSLPTTIMRGASSSGYVEHSIGYTSSTTSGVTIRNISNYRERHKYVFEGIGQDANSDVLPDWTFDNKYVDYDNTLFGAEFDKDTRTIRYYPLTGVEHDHDNGLGINIPFISGVTYTCSFTLTTSIKAWISFRRSDDWGALLGSVDNKWTGIGSGTYSFSFTPTEDIEYGKLIIYTAGTPWDASENTGFVEAIISNLSVTASSSNLIVMSSYDDGEVVDNHFGHLSSLSYMDTNASTTFCIGQVSNMSGIRNFSARMYGITIDISGQSVLNLVPCRRDSDSASGFYDTVGRQFHVLNING